MYVIGTSTFNGVPCYSIYYIHNIQSSALTFVLNGFGNHPAIDYPAKYFIVDDPNNYDNTYIAFIDKNQKMLHALYGYGGPSQTTTDAIVNFKEVVAAGVLDLSKFLA